MIPDYVPIKGSSLARDMRSLGVVETDPKKIDEYKHKKLMANSLTEQQQIRKEVTDLQNDVGEIKQNLNQILSLLEKIVNQGT